MKKSKKRLMLNRETLRTLTAEDAKNVDGLLGPWSWQAWCVEEEEPDGGPGGGPYATESCACN